MPFWATVKLGSSGFARGRLSLICFFMYIFSLLQCDCSSWTTEFVRFRCFTCRTAPSVLTKTWGIKLGCILWVYDFYSRPSSNEVLSHCVFWNEGKQLIFFLDVSDRLEKEPVSSRVLQCIESRAKLVIGSDWKNKITDDLRTGMFDVILS